MATPPKKKIIIKEHKEVDADGKVWMVSADGTSRRPVLGALSESPVETMSKSGIEGWKKFYDENTIGKRIRMARTAEDMTQQEFAELLGVSQSAVGSWEKDQTMPKKQNMAYSAKRQPAFKTHE